MTYMELLAIYQNYCQMDVNLIHHGYNVERRKMYPSNPRNNMISSVDLAWEKSLENQKQYLNHQLITKKEEELENISQNYTKAIEAKIQQEAKFNKNSFRVMPIHPIQTRTQKSSLAVRDSLADQLNSYRDKLKGQSGSFHIEMDSRKYNTQNLRNQVVDVDENKRKPVQNSNNISSTVFGYNLNYQTFKRQSYMSKLLSDRLQPYLSKSVDKKIAKHSSIAINSPVPVYYE